MRRQTAPAQLQTVDAWKVISGSKHAAVRMLRRFYSRLESRVVQGLLVQWRTYAILLSETERSHPPVVFSYSTPQEGLMIRVREALFQAGIESVDGTCVPPGQDWRRFYFPALARADVLIPILSADFLMSGSCEQG